MKFKDWLDSKLIITDLTEKDLGGLGFSWSKTSLDVLKKYIMHINIQVY